MNNNLYNNSPSYSLRLKENINNQNILFNKINNDFSSCFRRGEYILFLQKFFIFNKY